MKLRRAIEQFVPDGFRDEDGVWYDGPHRAAALAELDALFACVEALKETTGYIRAHLAGNDANPELAWALEEGVTALAALDGEQNVRRADEQAVSERRLNTLGSLQRSLAAERERTARLTEALERIASPDCQLACASLPNHAPCSSCVARAALAALDEEQT